MADLNQALALDGTIAAAYAERGAILQKLRDLDRAAADFARCAPAYICCHSDNELRRGGCRSTAKMHWLLCEDVGGFSWI